MAWLDGWLNRREITIDNTYVDAALSNFPVIVRMQNLAVNGNFESGVTSWSPSNCTATRVGHMKKIGSYCMKLTATAASAYAYQQCGGSIYPEFAGKLYSISAWVWADTPNTARVGIYPTSTGYYSAYHPGDSTWRLLTASCTVPSSPTRLLATLWVNINGTTAYFDGVFVHEGAPPDPWHFFSRSLSTGYDTRFTSSDGVTLLKFERARWDAANGIAEFYVKVPSVSASAPTKIYLYYNNPYAANNADPTNVWDANYKAVWHMADATTSTIADSTSNASTGTKLAANQPIQANHRFGLGQNNDGIDDYIATSGTGQSGSFTISGWLNKQGVSGTTPGYGTFIGSASANRLLIPDGGADLLAQMGAGNHNAGLAFPLLAWVHVAYVYNSSTTTAQWFVNGVAGATKVGAISLAAFRIGHYGTAAYMWNGFIDEVRLSNTNRSAAWIKADYYASEGGLLSIGAVQYPDQHLILEASYFASSQEINRVFIAGEDRSGNPVSGMSKLDAEISLVGERLEMRHNPAAYTAAVSGAVAAAILSRNRLDQRRAELVIPPHCGLELWDVLAVYDPVANQETFYRVAGYQLEYDTFKGAYFHRLQLCAV